MSAKSKRKKIGHHAQSSRLFAQLLVQEWWSRPICPLFQKDGAIRYLDFLKSLANPDKTSRLYCYHLAVRTICGE